MRTHRSLWTTCGEVTLVEYRFLGIWFYRRITTQKWSPLMHQFERERGIRIGHCRFGVTETVKKFFDGKEPSVIKGSY